MVLTVFENKIKNTKTTPMTSSDVFIVNFERIFTPFSGVSVVRFEQVNVS